MLYIGLLLLAQALYSFGDLFRKFILHGQEFNLGLLLSVAFWGTLVMSLVAFIVQLYVLKHYDLSRTTIILGSVGLILSTILGVVFLKERFSFYDYIGLGFAVLAVVFTHIR